MLLKKSHVIIYVSSKMKSHKANYPTHKLEFGALVFSLKIWHHYLYGVRCTIFMDRKSLQYLLDQLILNTRQHRWLDILKDCDYEILYRPGKANVVAEAVSQNTASTPTQNLCLALTIVSLLLDIIKGDQADAFKEENKKKASVLWVRFLLLTSTVEGC